MARIKLIDKVFETSITETQIQEHVKAVADRINKDMADKNPLLLAVLNGSFMFAADLMRMLTIPCEISFVKLASYQGTTSTGTIKEVIGINEDLAGRTVIIVEDIVESGLTIKRMIESLGTRSPKSIHIGSKYSCVKLKRSPMPISVAEMMANGPLRFISKSRKVVLPKR